MKRTWFDAAAEIAWNRIQKDIELIRGIRYCHPDGQYIQFRIFDYINFLSNYRFGTIGFFYNHETSFNEFKRVFKEVLERDKTEGRYGHSYYNNEARLYDEWCISCQSQKICSRETKDKNTEIQSNWRRKKCPNYKWRS